MLKYDWGFFFEDGMKMSLLFGFGPEHPDNLIIALDDPWLLRAYEELSTLRGMLEERPFGFVVVNPPQEHYVP